MKRGLLVISIVVYIFIIFFVALVFLANNSNFQQFITNIISPTTVEETIETKESITIISTESIIETVAEIEPILTTTMSNYTYKDSVNIEYPIIDGMADKNLQERVNKKIFDNAKSIVELYPISTSMQELNINARVNELNENIITIIYEGRVVGYTVKNSSTNNTYNSEFNNNTDNFFNNYQITGDNNFFGVVPNITSQNGWEPVAPIINGNGGNINQMPNANGDYIPVAPGGVGDYAQISPNGIGDYIPVPPNVFGFTKTIEVNQKIFYTNTIDLQTAKDIYLSEKVDPEKLAKYARSSKAEIVNLENYNENEIRTYIRKSTVTALTDVFTNADFKNKKMNYWPKSFSYVDDGDLYFTVRLSSKLGNYALIKYPLNK